MDIINFNQKIPFKINKKVLNYILENGVNDGLILSGLHIDTLTDNKKKKDIISHNSRYY